MDLWFIIKERYIYFSIILIILIVSLFLLVATWKIRSDMPRSLRLIITIIAILIIVLSIFALMFVASFGYNF